MYDNLFLMDKHIILYLRNKDTSSRDLRVSVHIRCLEVMAAYALRAPCPGEWPPCPPVTGNPERNQALRRAQRTRIEAVNM